jgi:hypothetical protein
VDDDVNADGERDTFAYRLIDAAAADRHVRDVALARLCMLAPPGPLRALVDELAPGGEDNGEGG